MHAFVGQDATSIALGESVGGLTGIMFRRCCEARSKYFSAWTLAGALPARGGLNPVSGFYIPYFPWCSLGNCHQSWKMADSDGSKIAASLRTSYFCAILNQNRAK